MFLKVQTQQWNQSTFRVSVPAVLQRRQKVLMNCVKVPTEQSLRLQLWAPFSLHGKSFIQTRCMCGLLLNISNITCTLPHWKKTTPPPSSAPQPPPTSHQKYAQFKFFDSDPQTEPQTDSAIITAPQTTASQIWVTQLDIH